MYLIYPLEAVFELGLETWPRARWQLGGVHFVVVLLAFQLDILFLHLGVIHLNYFGVQGVDVTFFLPLLLGVGLMFLCLHFENFGFTDWSGLFPL